MAYTLDADARKPGFDFDNPNFVPPPPAGSNIPAGVWLQAVQATRGRPVHNMAEFLEDATRAAQQEIKRIKEARRQEAQVGMNLHTGRGDDASDAPVPTETTARLMSDIGLEMMRVTVGGLTFSGREVKNAATMAMRRFGKGHEEIAQVAVSGAMAEVARDHRMGKHSTLEEKTREGCEDHDFLHQHDQQYQEAERRHDHRAMQLMAHEHRYGHFTSNTDRDRFLREAGAAEDSSGLQSAFRAAGEPQGRPSAQMRGYRPPEHQRPASVVADAPKPSTTPPVEKTMYAAPSFKKGIVAGV